MIEHRFLEHAADMTDLIAGARHAREIMNSEPMADHVRGEAFPGDDGRHGR